MTLRLPFLTFVSAFAFQPLSAEVLTFDQAEVAGMSGFRAFWDAPVAVSPDGAVKERPKILKTNDDPKDGRFPTAVWTPGGAPGALAIDALQRSLLVRFPGAAEKIAETMAAGNTIKKVELVLPFRDTELVPPGNTEYAPADGGYYYRTNWGTGELWLKSLPQWHAVAWALRKPWSAADPAQAPTYNAFINGTGFWTKFGAQDEKQDRFPGRFGPAEVSFKNPEGRLDVTSLLTNSEFGATPAERLRVLSDNGFLVKKWETYDHRYFTGVYEWATATGGRAILLNAPKLAVTFEKGKPSEPLGTLPPAADIPALAGKIKGTPEAGKPTALMPTPEEIRKLEARYDSKPKDMPEWQWTRLKELSTAGREDKSAEPFYSQFVSNYAKNQISEKVRENGKMVVKAPSWDTVYASWVDYWLGRQTRGWSGHEAAKTLLHFTGYGDALPAPAQDSIKAYWTGWLMPDRPTSDLVHPMIDQLSGKGSQSKAGPTESYVTDSYHKETGDWRGNKSFYRAGFTETLSTQNFNVSASTGALIGGKVIASEYAMEDGRRGMVNFPLTLYSWTYGSGQEHIDHYYFAITLVGNKMFKDFGPTAFDRLAGESMMVFGMEELTSTYHPGLRRFIAPASRTGLEYLLGTQEGVTHIMHTLSEQGALLDEKAEHGTPASMPLYGHDAPPEIIFQQAMISPWAEPWQAAAVDHKPLPFEATSRYLKAIRRSYLGENYGLSSSSEGEGRIKAMAQWRREAKPVTRAQDFATMDIRYGFNETMFASSGGGFLAPYGTQAAVQEKNKMLVVTSPNVRDVGGLATQGPKDPPVELKSLQSAIGIFNYQQPAPTWEIFVNGKKLESLPATAKQGDLITIKDGVSYIGIIPLPATDLGRDAEVVIKGPGPEQFASYNKKLPYRTALSIESFNLKKEASIGADFDWAKANRAFGGFAVEFGDEKDFGSFEKFQAHMKEAKVSTKWDAKTGLVTANFLSGGDDLQVSRETWEDGGAWTDSIATLVNGKKLLPDGILRDTPLTTMGKSGRLEKNGAILESEFGLMSFLSTAPEMGITTGLNPLPVPSVWSLQAPSGLRLTADGKVGLTQVVINDKTDEITIKHEFSPVEEASDKLAKNFLLFGAKAEPKIVLNGQTAQPVKVAIGTETAWAIPLGGETPDSTAISERYARLADWKKDGTPTIETMKLYDWRVAGPFPGGTGQTETEFAPEIKLAESEGKVDLKASYPMEGMEPVTWKAQRHTEAPMGGRSGAPIFPVSDKPATFYAVAQVESKDLNRVTVTAKLDGDSTSVVSCWVNGVKQRVPNPGGGTFEVTLQPGITDFLFRITQTQTTKEPEKLSMSLGIPIFNTPMVQTVSYVLADGSRLPVNPARTGGGVDWQPDGQGGLLAVPRPGNKQP